MLSRTDKLTKRPPQQAGGDGTTSQSAHDIVLFLKAKVKVGSYFSFQVRNRSTPAAEPYECFAQAVTRDRRDRYCVRLHDGRNGCVFPPFDEQPQSLVAQMPSQLRIDVSAIVVESMKVVDGEAFREAQRQFVQSISTNRGWRARPTEGGSKRPRADDEGEDLDNNTTTATGSMCPSGAVDDKNALTRPSMDTTLASKSVLQPAGVAPPALPATTAAGTLLPAGATDEGGVMTAAPKTAGKSTTAAVVGPSKGGYAPASSRAATETGVRYTEDHRCLVKGEIDQKIVFGLFRQKMLAVDLFQQRQRNATNSTTTITDGNSEGTVTLANRYLTAPSPVERDQRYKKLVKVGEGTFGEVYVTRDLQQDRFVCMKMIRVPFAAECGVHNTFVREVAVASMLKHPNVLPLLDSIVSPDGVCVLIYPLVAHDLPGLLRVWRHSRRGSEPGLAAIKCIFRQVLQGIAHMHQCNVVHRDIKPSNMLIHHDGVAMICDFGWSRVAHYDLRLHTFPPCTVWFRAFEILLGSRDYGFEVDIWALGCVLFEMLAFRPLIQVDTESEAVRAIVAILGPPPQEVFPIALHEELSWLSLNEAVQPREQPIHPLKNYCSTVARFPNDAVDFLFEMLRYDRKLRMTAKELVEHPWLAGTASGPSGSVLPCKPKDLVLPTDNHYSFYSRAADAKKDRELWVGKRQK